MRRLAFLLLLLASQAAAAPVSLSLAQGERRVSFDFAADRTGPEALRIETHRVGNPGARLAIWIDRSPTPLFSGILTSDQCGYDDAGARCVLTVAGGTPDYDRFVTAFRLGLVAHVEVENANVMEMRSDLSLLGFTKAYGD